MRALLLFTLVLPLAGQDFYRSLEDGKQAREMLPRYFKARANEALLKREQRLATVKDWDAYRRQFREDVLKSIGGLPVKTPLNAKVVGSLDRDGYRIEKVIFESQPKFYVTANLYLPKSGQAPYPGILFPLGHESGAKSHDAWQMVLANLARRGFVLLAWDPIGQGERIQLWDEDFRNSKVLSSTVEHTMVGAQSLLLGDAVARYTIHDSIRALDYLASRPEVDPKRIGLTGNSGGGTHTSYIAALDDRISVAAPSCYITNWRKLLDTIGPQDGEQWFPGFLANGYDHPDFILSFAPKPFLILSAVRDFFSIGGARESYAEASRIYDARGAGGKIAMVEADDGHGYTRPRREAAYRWFTRWLQGKEDTSPETAVDLVPEKDLNCTNTGQVVTSLGGETVWTLNYKRLNDVRRKGTLEDVRRVSAFVAREAPLTVSAYGGDAGAERVVYETEAGIRIPAVIYKPEGSGRFPARIIAHGRGKAAAMDRARRYAAQGQLVMAIDARGFGETAPGELSKGTQWQSWFGDYDSATTAILLSKPLVTMRAEDISAGVGLLLKRPDVDASRIALEGIDAGAVPALLAKALDNRISSLRVEGMLRSYEDVVKYRIHRRVMEQVIPGALRVFDLPDLVKLTGAVEVVSMVDPLGMPIP